MMRQLVKLSTASAVSALFFVFVVVIVAGPENNNAGYECGGHPKCASQQGFESIVNGITQAQFWLDLLDDWLLYFAIGALSCYLYQRWSSPEP